MPNNKPGSRLIKAAGAVVWRPGPDGQPEILLVHRKKYDDWSLPKGKTEPGESLPVTAAREVLEESGARVALGRRLISVRYNVGGRPKRVHYWAARVDSLDERAVPNAEVDEVTWLSAARAVEKVSYVHDHGVLADFAAWPAGTVPLVLLRHAKAAAKGSWKRSDEVRPLDDSGRSDAKALADLLACFAARPRLISSTALRCTDTVRPLALLTGARVREEPSLYVRGQASGSGAAMTALVREAIASGEPTVICAHRENIPALQEAALAALAGHPGAEVPAAELPGPSGTPADAVAGGPVAEVPREWDDELPPGGFWVLNVAPMPQEPEQAGEPEPAGKPEPAGEPDKTDPAPPAQAPGRRWWQFIRPRAGSAGGDPGTGAAAGEAGRAAGGEAGRAVGGAAGGEDDGAVAADDRPDVVARPGAARRNGAAGLAGVLVSADRYDLAEP